MADFGRDPRSSESERQPHFLYFFVFSNAQCRRFPVGNISRTMYTTTSIGEAVKTFGT